MNKYFIKRVPVKNGFQRVVKSKEGIPIDHQVEVKTYLCSRDIKVGDTNVVVVIAKDKMYHTAGAVKRHDDETLVVQLSSISNPLIRLKDEDFKIVARVSGGATWIKEGDEFDKEDVQSSYKGKIQLLPIYDHDYRVALLGSRKQKEAIFSNLPIKEYIALFKCPVCKDFH